MTYVLGNLHKWMFCPRSAAFIWTNPRRQHAWFRPLITAECDDKGIRDAFAYEGQFMAEIESLLSKFEVE